MEILTRKTCRVCDSSRLTELYSLGNLCISNFVKETSEEVPAAPLEMILCENCSLVQLRHTAPQELLYARFYWYRSGVTDTMKKALREITEEIENFLPLKAGDVVLDIGSNDGTLLRTYSVPGLVTVGVEPASNLAEEGKQGLSHFIDDFWNIESYQRRIGKKARVITAIGMFYDMEDPNLFIRDTAMALSEDGIFVAQLMCLKNMIDTGDVGNICHEHLEFYSLSALQYLFKKNGLQILDVTRNEVNGGSYRIYAALQEGKMKPTASQNVRVKRLFEEEKGLDRKETHRAFFEKMESNKKKCVDFIKSEVAKGKKVWVYGASTKGNTLLQYYGLDASLIGGASDRSPEKWGKLTVGTRIPIYSEEEARRFNPDYFLVLPYAFLDEFYKRESLWRSQGGKFIVPLPEFRVVP